MPTAANPTFKATLVVRDACLCMHVQRAARALARRFDDALRPVGVTNGQFSLMMSLNRPEPPDMVAVSSLLGMNRTTLTAALKPLQRRRLLRVTVDPADRRSRVMTLTPKGRRLLARAVPVWRRTHISVEALLPDSDPNRFRNNLRAVS
jgi:DNA-binding MarR family transcriptional regulator